MPLFNFRLKPLRDIIQGLRAIEFDVPHYLSGWFWLTDGRLVLARNADG